MDIVLDEVLLDPVFDPLEPRAICWDCGELLWMTPEDWADSQLRTTCWNRKDIGHVPVPIDSDLGPPIPVGPGPH